MKPTVDDPHTAVFEAHRGHVFGVAYRMLGQVAEAEDVVQETWLRWRGVELSTVRSPPAYLGTVAGRVALDRLRSARHQRESYVGPWLPEPLVSARDRRDDPTGDPETHAETADSLTFGFLCVLERLDPLERAVFLLREVFGYPYAEISTAVDRTEATCRQIAHRARTRVADEGRDATRRADRDPEAADRVAGALVAATLAGDVAGVERLLTDDIVVLTDGGADHHAARRPVVGPHRAARLLVNLASRLPEGMSFERVQANGDPAVLLRDEHGAPAILVAVEVEGAQVDGAQVDRIHIVVNPDKLAHL